jgi:hypothetical protein
MCSSTVRGSGGGAGKRSCRCLRPRVTASLRSTCPAMATTAQRSRG